MVLIIYNEFISIIIIIVTFSGYKGNSVAFLPYFFFHAILFFLSLTCAFSSSSYLHHQRPPSPSSSSSLHPVTIFIISLLAASSFFFLFLLLRLLCVWVALLLLMFSLFPSSIDPLHQKPWPVPGSLLLPLQALKISSAALPFIRAHHHHLSRPAPSSSSSSLHHSRHHLFPLSSFSLSPSPPSVVLFAMNTVVAAVWCCYPVTVSHYCAAA